MRIIININFLYNKEKTCPYPILMTNMEKDQEKVNFFC